MSQGEEPFSKGADDLRARERIRYQWMLEGTTKLRFFRTLNGIFWILYTGAHWRELPERYDKRSSVHDRLTRWRKDGTRDRILERLHLKLDEQGRLDLDLWCVDATQMRASRAAAGARGENGGPRGRRAR
jgi:transposase